MRRVLVLAVPVLFGLAAPAVAQDVEVKKILTSTRWCMLSKPKDNRQETAQFGNDGLARVSGNTGPGGVARTETFRWKVQQGGLLLSEDGTNWTNIHFKVFRDPAGRAVIEIEGDAYQPCP